MDVYNTIEDFTVSEILKIKKSKFIGYAIPITNENEVKASLNQVKAEHPNASHWCYAYQFGIDTITYRANDDGEPSNSAGKPIYGQIQSFKLTNILVVVVRYYGGTKLGVGGLISAYKESAKLALDSSSIIEKVVTKRLQLNFGYNHINTIMRILKLHQLEIEDQQMNLDCEMIIVIPKKNFEIVKDKIDTIYGVNTSSL